VTAPDVAEVPAEEVQESAPESAVPAEESVETGTGLEQLPGVGEKTLANLREGGFSSLESVANASIENLTQVKGVGEKKAESLIAEAKKLLGK